MPRYIDADAYIKYCEEKWIPLNVDAVKAQSTADVVEVVRCKDCKWWRDTDHTCREWGGASPRLANDFCSEGERREDG